MNKTIVIKTRYQDDKGNRIIQTAPREFVLKNAHKPHSTRHTTYDEAISSMRDQKLLS